MSLNGFENLKNMTAQEIIREAMRYRSRRTVVLFVGGVLAIVIISLAIFA